MSGQYPTRALKHGEKSPHDLTTLKKTLQYFGSLPSYPDQRSLHPRASHLSTLWGEDCLGEGIDHGHGFLEAQPDGSHAPVNLSQMAVTGPLRGVLVGVLASRARPKT